jgi:hypothetical protein
MCWAWPLAARAAWDLRDAAATGELLALLDACQPGQLAPMQRAERDLARARLAAGDGDPAAAAPFAAAIGGLRELSTPYHLAHGLLDHAGYLTRRCLGNVQIIQFGTLPAVMLSRYLVWRWRPARTRMRRRRSGPGRAS